MFRSTVTRVDICCPISRRTFIRRAAAMHVYTHRVVRSVNAALDIRPITGLLNFDATVNFD